MDSGLVTAEISLREDKLFSQYYKAKYLDR